MTKTFEVTRGTLPVILGFPHTGTAIPEAIAHRLNDKGKAIADTDWHIHQLYADLLPGASSIRALFHRYVLDVNRDPDGQSLYPDQNTTGLVPLTDFDGQPIWNHGQAPDEKEMAARCLTFHKPYHDALAAEIERVRALHGVAVVFDCHSIRSTIPFLFAGTLPDFNIGTNNGLTCSAQIEEAVAQIAGQAKGFTSVLNGRFKGGWTTRHYAKRHDNIHAIQLELAQVTHLVSESAPFALDPSKAAQLRPHLQSMLERITAVALSLNLKE